MFTATVIKSQTSNHIVTESEYAATQRALEREYASMQLALLESNVSSYQSIEAIEQWFDGHAETLDLQAQRVQFLNENSGIDMSNFGGDSKISPIELEFQHILAEIRNNSSSPVEAQTEIAEWMRNPDHSDLIAEVQQARRSKATNPVVEEIPRLAIGSEVESALVRELRVILAERQAKLDNLREANAQASPRELQDAIAAEESYFANQSEEINRLHRLIRIEELRQLSK